MNALRTALPLTFLAAVCTAVIATVHLVTADRIATIGETRALHAAKAVMPVEVVRVEKRLLADGEPCFDGFDATGTCMARAAVGRATGFGGTIELIVGCTDEGVLTGYRNLKSSETPGLGSHLASDSFAGQFVGIGDTGDFRIVKDGGKIRPITSATITSRAVCEAVKDARRKIVER